MFSPLAVNISAFLIMCCVECTCWTSFFQHCEHQIRSHFVHVYGLFMHKYGFDCGIMYMALLHVLHKAFFGSCFW
jgi:hypothetical protein